VFFNPRPLPIFSQIEGFYRRGIFRNVKSYKLENPDSEALFRCKGMSAALANSLTMERLKPGSAGERFFYTTMAMQPTIGSQVRTAPRRRRLATAINNKRKMEIVRKVLFFLFFLMHLFFYFAIGSYTHDSFRLNNGEDRKAFF
jgi:hypothetical protein